MVKSRLAPSARNAQTDNRKILNADPKYAANRLNAINYINNYSLPHGFSQKTFPFQEYYPAPVSLNRRQAWNTIVLVACLLNE